TNPPVASTPTHPPTLGGEPALSWLRTCISFVDVPLLTLTTPNGQYLNWTGIPDPLHAQPTADVQFGWNFCPDRPAHYIITTLPGALGVTGIIVYWSGDPMSTDTALHSDFRSSKYESQNRFKVFDQGNRQFSLAAADLGSGVLYPIIVGSDGIMRWAAP